MRDERRAAAGFSLIEVTIALGVLAVGLMAMLALQLHALRGGSLGRHASAAAMIARDQLELVQRLPFSSADLAPVAWTTPPWLAR